MVDENERKPLGAKALKLKALTCCQEYVTLQFKDPTSGPRRESGQLRAFSLSCEVTPGIL